MALPLPLESLQVVYKRPVTLTDTPTHYCPGCTHGVAHRLVAEVLDEMGSDRKDHWRCLGRLLGLCLQLFQFRFRPGAARSCTCHGDRRQARTVPTNRFSPTRAMAIWHQLAWLRSSTRPRAAKISPSFLSTIPIMG